MNVPIEIHVNPSNAAESIVVKNIIWEHMSKLLVGFIISWAVFLWLVYVLVFKLGFCAHPLEIGIRN